MKRIECLRTLAPLVTDELVVTSLTGANWEWRYLTEHEGSMNVSSMGSGVAVAAGMALGLPSRRVIALESDGSSLMDLSCLATLASYQPANLKVFVFDNEVYSGSRISHRSPTGIRTSLAAMAQGAGIVTAVTVHDVASFEREAQAALREPGLRYVVAKVEEDPEARKLPKPTVDYLENKYHFLRYIERTEGKKIFPTLR
jgi:thiamine pyrophosphate-dependent acetolactate synthase large subunit-like protein